MASDKNEHGQRQQHDEPEPKPGAGPAARTPQQDHTPRQEEQAHRERHQAAAPSAADKEAAEKAAAEQREARAFGSIGAQIILDYNGDGSLGARGGAAGTIEENSAAYESHMVALGLDPLGPSGPPPSMEVRKARQAAAEAQAKANEQIAAAHATPGAGAASRVSSLAAGLITEPADVPIDPGDTLSGGRSAA